MYAPIFFALGALAALYAWSAITIIRAVRNAPELREPRGKSENVR